jgi:hypothetical protein
MVHVENETMVITYFEIGRTIVEEEQNGAERAGYGKEILKGLSVALKKEFGKGYSVDNLENMRRFYLAYGKSGTASRISQNQISETVSRKSNTKKQLEHFKRTRQHNLPRSRPARRCRRIWNPTATRTHPKTQLRANRNRTHCQLQTHPSSTTEKCGD